MNGYFNTILKERRKVDCIVPSIDNFKNGRVSHNGGGGETDKKKKEIKFALEEEKEWKSTRK